MIEHARIFSKSYYMTIKEDLEFWLASEEKTKESIKTEGDIAKKIILLDKLQKLKKKEYNYGRN